MSPFPPEVLHRPPNSSVARESWLPWLCVLAQFHCIVLWVTQWAAAFRSGALVFVLRCSSSSRGATFSCRASLFTTVAFGRGLLQRETVGHTSGSPRESESRP
jgi:hypothetical protein